MDMLKRLAENLPRIEIYEELFPCNEQVQVVVALLYGDVVEFCVGSYKFFSRKGMASELVS